MRALDLLGAVRGVFAHRIRTALTLVGVVIGTGSIVVLASLIHGAEDALTRASQQASESDLVQVDADEPPEKDRHKTRRDLSRRDATALGESDLLRGTAVGAEVSHASEARAGGRKRRVHIAGARPSSRALYRLNVARGRFFADADLEDNRRVAVIGWEVHHDLGEPALDGLAIEADGHLWTVIGILEKKPILGSTTSTNIWDRKVLVPDTTYDAVFSPSHKVGRLHVRREASALSIGQIRAAVDAALLRRHFNVRDFRLRKDADDAQEKLILTVVKLLLLTTGLMALFVGGINIMNVMLVTVTERTREIGIRRAVGATPRIIVLQFLTEAAAISFTGGVVGVLGGIAVAWAVSAALGALAGQWAFRVEPWSLVAGLGLSIVTGLVFGALPARRASRIRPIEALRFE